MVLTDVASAIAWPVAVTLIVALFLITQRHRVGGLLDRLLELGFPGFRAKLAEPPARQPDPAVELDGEAYLEEADFFEDVVADYENALAEAGAEAASLRQQLGRKTVFGDFEWTYNHIFGSQVQALRLMVAAPGGIVDAHEIEASFEAAQAENPEQLGGWRFALWVHFLTSPSELGPLSLLVAGGYQIAPRGRGFLAYVDQLNYPAKAL